MDCNFINQNDIHEKYLLDRLNESEKSEYLSHLNSCESCKSKLESEKDLIGSVRHIGNNEMKSEIAKQVAQIKSRENNVSWDMILKVAAIFFFLVITPGLVYYYQSVEPPKISELYDFDEILSQQKEIGKVEADEALEARDTAIGKRKTEIKETTSDLLKSASGAGTQPSVQSIGMTKPANKSASHVETLAELAAEDELDIETKQSLPQSPKPATRSASIAKTLKKSEKTKESISEQSLDDVMSFKDEQPKAAVPKSIIPELEKFHKSKFFQVKDHEYFKGKEYRNNTQTYPGPPTIYEMPPKQNSIKTDKGIYLKKLRAKQIYRLDYTINSEKYWVNLVPLYEKTDFYYQESYPDSFPVIKKMMYSKITTFDFFINEKIRKADPAEISIYFGENDILYLNILNEKFYQIDLKSDSTKAVTIQ